MQLKGPLLLACNHPNSFLDAVILGAFFKRPVHFLARGDVFKNKFAAKTLAALRAIPIYRLSEGKENLALNDATFGRCAEILAQGGIVLIFSEGICVQQRHLLSLKKGTARIALQAWQQPLIQNSFRVLPVSLNYSSFTALRFSLLVHFGKEISRAQLPQTDHIKQIAELNALLKNELQAGILETADDIGPSEFLAGNAELSGPLLKQNMAELRQVHATLFDPYFSSFINRLKWNRSMPVSVTQALATQIFVVLFSPFAFIVLLVHWPLYFFIKRFVKRKTADTIFYHSVLFCLMVITYILYCVLIALVVSLGARSFIGLISIVLLPLSGLLAMYWHDALESVINFNIVTKPWRKNLLTLFGK